MSSIALVKAALVAILTPALPDTQVIPGPVDVTMLRSRVLEVGGESTPILIQVTSLDGSSRTETYTLMLTASVSQSGTILGVAEASAVDDCAAAVAAIVANPSLGLDNLNATVTGNAELTESANAQGRSAAVRFPVEIFATL